MIEGHGRPFPDTRLTFQQEKLWVLVVVACRIILSAGLLTGVMYGQMKCCLLQRKLELQRMQRFLNVHKKCWF